MFWSPRQFPAWVVVGLLLTALPHTADAAGKEEAKAAYEEGRAAANAGRFKDAVKHFKRSVDADPNPQTRLELAKALVGDGKLVDANAVLNDLLNATPPVVWSVKSAAQKLRAEIEPRIPWLQIKIVGPDPALTSISIDMKDIDRAKIDVDSEIPMNPGQHVIGAEADGYDDAEKSVTLIEGAHEVVELTLAKKGSVSTSGQDLDASTKPKGGGLTDSPMFIPMAAGFGVGVVGLGVGGVFGILAISKANEVKDTCKGSVCPNSSRNKTAKEDSLLYGNVSTVGFIAGGVGVAAGAVLLVLTLNATPPKPKETGAFIKPWVGLGEAGVYGAF